MLERYPYNAATLDLGTIAADLFSFVLFSIQKVDGLQRWHLCLAILTMNIKSELKALFGIVLQDTAFLEWNLSGNIPVCLPDGLVLGQCQAALSKYTCASRTVCTNLKRAAL